MRILRLWEFKFYYRKQRELDENTNKIFFSIHKYLNGNIDAKFHFSYFDDYHVALWLPNAPWAFGPEYDSRRGQILKYVSSLCIILYVESYECESESVTYH